MSKSRFFLCLANSYKHDNRCLAGVLVKHTYNGGYEIIQDDWGHPIWFRPINRWTDAGAIPNDEAEGINLFDVIEVTDSEPCPDGAQQENHYYSSLSYNGHVEMDNALLNLLSRTNRKVLFGNAYNAVSHDYYERLEYSILMIHASNVRCYLKKRENKQPQPRMEFTFNGNEYDFPITDPKFRHLLENDKNDANAASEYYLTLSLGAICDDKHFKLVAGVIMYDDNDNDFSNILESAHESYRLFKQGLSIAQIAKRRLSKEDTIATHLVPFVERGLIEPGQLVPNEHIEKILRYYRQHPYENHLKPFYEAFDGEISYSSIKIILASTKNK